MQLLGLSLQNFRNYANQTFFFSPKVSVIVAKNASGKTSIIEAVSLLSTGESFRAEEVADMIRFEEEIARVKAKIQENNEETTELEVDLTRGMVQGKRVQSKLYSVNNVRRRKKDFTGHLYAVVFRPEDMRLIEGSPGRRRQFIDTLLSMSDPEYAVHLKTYEDALKRRNRLLDQIRDGQASRSVLQFWTQLVIKHGEAVQEKRRQLFSFFPGVQFPASFEIKYEASVISEERMNEYAEKEIMVGHMLIGPHKDDFIVNLILHDGQFHNVAQFGSRGQQRLAVLWLKTAELQYLQQERGVRPVLLLDDILSELDKEHRQYVLSLVSENQSIITTTEERFLEEIQEKTSHEIQPLYLNKIDQEKT
jgi:DNA replication and repair protein RecF